MRVLEELDHLVGNVIHTIEEIRGENAVIVVLSDHGFVDSEMEIHMNEALKNAGLITVGENGRISSWEAYASQTHGSAAIFLRCPEDPIMYEYVHSFLQDFSREHSCLEAVILSKHYPDSCFVGSSFILDAKKG